MPSTKWKKQTQLEKETKQKRIIMKVSTYFRNSCKKLGWNFLVATPGSTKGKRKVRGTRSKHTQIDRRVQQVPWRPEECRLKIVEPSKNVSHKVLCHVPRIKCVFMARLVLRFIVPKAYRKQRITKEDNNNNNTVQKKWKECQVLIAITWTCLSCLGRLSLLVVAVPDED